MTADRHPAAEPGERPHITSGRSVAPWSRRSRTHAAGSIGVVLAHPSARSVLVPVGMAAPIAGNLYVLEYRRSESMWA
jgi:hypothetical protein